MSQPKPYFLTARQFMDGEYMEGGRYLYIKHPDYSNKPTNYVRAFMLIQKDVLELFNYIEPSRTNLKTYSFRIHELFMRTCIELEANFKNILFSNKYSTKKNLNIEDYYKINSSHFLSSYIVKPPYWSGDLRGEVRHPFRQWANPKDPKTPWSLQWYTDYNSVKHDRVNSLHLANFENLLDAFGALVILLTSQYLFEDFSKGNDYLIANTEPGDSYDLAIGGQFRVRVPGNLPKQHRYEFNWQDLSNSNSPFVKYDYDSL